MSNDIPTRPEDLRPYTAAGYTLIPLFRWDRTSTHKNGKPRQDGKRPMDNDWTRKPYQNAKAITHMEGGSNVGVRLEASQLVIDVDPRNMPDGRDTFTELCEAVGLDPDLYPKVETGSGGLHVYMRKPADVSVLDSLEGYDGVEFKTKGRQVVAAGSKHPDGGMYDWDFLAPDLSEAGEAPERLLSLIRRPARVHALGGGGGEYDQVEVARMLDALDPEDFRDHGDWLTLMMSCHHASGGDARSEFIEWSTRDPEFQDDGWIIGRRWDSLHREKDGPTVTHRTLHKLLRDAGKGEVIPTIAAADDFDDDLELPGEEFDLDTPEHERKGPMARMNDRYWAVRNGGKFRIMFEEDDPSERRTKWVSMDKTNFVDYLSNKKVEKLDKKGEPTVVPLSKEWLEWGHRRTAQGVIFDPQRDYPGYLNLWRGWGVDPRPGDWSLMRELIRDVLCDGDEESGEFVIKWMAYMVQKPWEPPGVAICFHGDKGTGKSTLGEALVEMCGRHGLQVTSPRHVTGDFNSHLMDCVMLFADEAIAPSDKKGQASLKALITERHMAYEQKFMDMKTGVNRLHVMIASNDDWFVNASATDGERRYFVARVNNDRQGDIGFFGRLRAQMYEKGGLEAMLHDLQLLDISGWQPRGSIPNSTALAEQKLRNLEPVAAWWFNALDAGTLPFPVTDEEALPSWEEGEVRAFFQDMKDSFEQHCQRTKINPGANNRSIDRYFWAEMRKVCPNMKSGQELRDIIPEDRFDISPAGNSSPPRARCRVIPSLAECREYFEHALSSPVDWN